MNHVNKLKLGFGIKDMYYPFLYKNENNKNSYLAAYSFNISKKGGEESKVLYFPINFNLKVMYFDKTFFYYSRDNKLILLKYVEEKVEKEEDGKKIEKIEKNFKRYSFSRSIKEKYSEFEATNKDIKFDIIDKAIQKAEKIVKENKDLYQGYEELINILQNDLKETLVNPKTFKEQKANFIINTEYFKYDCELKNISMQVDEAGTIKESIQLETEEQIDFAKGIKAVEDCANNFDKKGYHIQNTFKSPILFKNFKGNIIPADRVVIAEFKSGFDVPGLKKQIKERINIVNNCAFFKGEKPEYFIGVVNVKKENVHKMKEYQDFNFDEFKKENILIICCVDYKYFELDMSTEVSADYLLHKDIQELGKKMDNGFNEINKRYEDLNKKVDKGFAKISEKIDLLISAICLCHPGFDNNFKKKF